MAKSSVNKGVKRLHSLDAAEVSLVPEGANRRRFLIFKSAKGNQMAQPNEQQQNLHKLISQTDPEVMKKVESHLAAHAQKMSGGKAPPAAPVEKAPETAMGPMDDQAHAAIKAIVRIASPFKGKIPADLMHQVLDAAGYEKAGDPVDPKLEETGNDDPAGTVGAEGDASHVGDGHKEAGFMAIPEMIEGEDDDVLKGWDGEEDDEGEDEDEGADDGDGELKGKKKKEGAKDGAKDGDKEDPKKEEGKDDGKKEAKKGAKKDVMKSHMHEAAQAAEGAYKEHMAKMGYEKYPEAKMHMKMKQEMQKTKDGDTVEKEKGEKVSKSATATPVLATVDPATKREMEAVFKSNKELVQKNADLEARVKAQEVAVREKEIVAKAATFSHIALPQEEIIATLKDADKVGKESFERVCKNFDTLNEQGKSSRLFGEFGSHLPNPGNSSDNAWLKIEKAAEGYVAKSGEKMSSAEATDRFLKTAEGQRMYADYKSGRKDGI